MRNNYDPWALVDALKDGRVRVTPSDTPLLEKCRGHTMNEQVKAKHKQFDNTFLVTIDGVTTEVRPVDGEEHFNEPGMPHGFVHFVDAQTGQRVGFCGTDYFDRNAVICL